MVEGKKKTSLSLHGGREKFLLPQEEFTMRRKGTSLNSSLILLEGAIV